MANTYTQLFIHFVFAVQNRLGLISPRWEEDMNKYINGIIEHYGHKLYLINGAEDHTHLLVSMNPKQSPSDLMFHVKRSSSLWINDNKLTIGKFSWQEGFGAFSFGKDQLSSKIKYVENQKEHHKKTSFMDEYLKFLKDSRIDFDEKYLFRPLE